jgi:hypothetical protein
MYSCRSGLSLAITTTSFPGRTLTPPPAALITSPTCWSNREVISNLPSVFPFWQKARSSSVCSLIVLVA